MSSLAVFGLVAVLAAATHNNPPPESLAREASPLTPVAAAATVRAQGSESAGRMGDAAHHWREAANAGSGEAAKRLGDLYWRGAPGVDRDFAESLRWYRVAETRGVKLAQAVRMR